MNDSTASGMPPRSAGGTQESQSGYSSHQRSSRSRSAPAGASAFVPVLLMTAGMLAWSGFQLNHLLLESNALATARAGQEAQLQQAQKVRQALDSVANETRKLAEAGNANAKVVVEELRKRGVTINAAPAATPTR